MSRDDVEQEAAAQSERGDKHVSYDQKVRAVEAEAGEDNLSEAAGTDLGRESRLLSLRRAC